MAPASSKTAKSGETEYIVGLNNNPRGPFSRDDLILMARGGLLNEKTRVFVKGWDKWKTIAEIPELAALIEDNPPTAPNAPATPTSPATPHNPASPDPGLRAAVESLQSVVERLEKELARRTDQLGEGQKITAEAAERGQKELASALKELQAADNARARQWEEKWTAFQSRQEAALGQSADKNKQEFSTLLEALEIGLGKRLENLEAAHKTFQRQWEEHQTAHKADSTAHQTALERLQQTMAAEKEKELLAFANRVEDMDRRFSALQQAFYLSTEQFKTDLGASLTSREEKIHAQQEESLKAAESRHQALLQRQGELAAAIAQVREQVEKRIEALTTERRAAQEDTTRMWAEIDRRLLRWDGELPELLQKVMKEVQSTPGRLDALFSRIEQEQQELSGRVQGVRDLVASQTENFGIRMDVQLQTLQAAAETRGAALAADLDQRALSLQELVTQLRDGIRDFEDTTLERYSVLLAAADDQRAIPDRVNNLITGITTEFTGRVEQIQKELSAHETRLREILKSGDARIAEVETRLSELSRVQAERLSEEMANAHQEQLRRQHASDEERQQHFAALSQAFNGMVSHLEEELPRHLTRIEEQFRGDLARTGSTQAEATAALEKRLLEELGKSSEAAAAASARLQGMVEKTTAETSRERNTQLQKSTEEATARQAEIRSWVESLGKSLAETSAAQQAALARSEEARRSALADLAAQLERKFEDGMREAAAATVRLEASLLEQADKNLQSVADLAGATQTAREAAMQSLGNLGGWVQTLHDKLEKGLVQSHTGLSGVKAELEKQIQSTHHAVEAALAAAAEARDLQHRQALESVESVGGAVAKLEKTLDGTATQTAKDLSSGLGHLQEKLSAGLEKLETRLASGQDLQGRTASELADAVSRVQEAQTRLEKSLTEDWNNVWGARWSALQADLSGMRTEADARRDQLAQRLADVEGKIPAAVHAQIKAQSTVLETALAGLARSAETAEKRLAEVRAELEKQITQHFASQHRSNDQLLKVLQEEVAGALGDKWLAIQKDVAAIKAGAPAAQKTLIEELHKAVARLPDHLTESYRVTNNAMQKQLAEMAQDVSVATQHVEQSRAALEKVGTGHLSSLEEFAETSRQQVAEAIRDAREERTRIQNQILEELKNWQLEQKKILAAVLKGTRAPDGDAGGGRKA